MFSLMVFGIALWLLYGVVVGDWPFIIADGVSLLFAATILLLKLRFG
jgi:MtN3 and saliva related transmembrane protein